MRWGGTLVTMMLLIAYAASGLWTVTYVTEWSGKGGFHLEAGWIAIVWRPPDGSGGYLTNPSGLILRRHGHPFLSCARSQYFVFQYGCVAIPLWLPALVCVIPTGVLWWKDRTRKGHCRSCGYDLTGNVSGVCPECGLAIESQEKRDCGMSS